MNIQSIGQKLTTKLKSLDTMQIVILSLWILTLVLMFVFIGVTAGITDKYYYVFDNEGNSKQIYYQEYSNIVAAMGGVFVLSLIASILTTVGDKYFKNKKLGGSRK